MTGISTLLGYGVEKFNVEATLASLLPSALTSDPSVLLAIISVALFALQTLLSSAVSGARRTYGVKYPIMYPELKDVSCCGACACAQARVSCRVSAFRVDPSLTRATRTAGEPERTESLGVSARRARPRELSRVERAGLLHDLCQLVPLQEPRHSLCRLARLHRWPRYERKTTSIDTDDVRRLLTRAASRQCSISSATPPAPARARAASCSRRSPPACSRARSPGSSSSASSDHRANQRRRGGNANENEN